MVLWVTFIGFAAVHSLTNAFQAKGHRKHECKKCSKTSKLEKIKLNDDIFMNRLLDQSHISSKNIKMLQEISNRYECEMREKAELLIKVAIIKPYKRKRISCIKRKAPELLVDLVKFHFVAYAEPSEECEVYPYDLYPSYDEGEYIYFEDDSLPSKEEIPIDDNFCIPF